MNLKRLVQKSAGGSNLVSVPREVIGAKHSKQLEMIYKYNTQVNSWTIELRERD
jgi:hypothetical protein